MKKLERKRKEMKGNWKKCQKMKRDERKREVRQQPRIFRYSWVFEILDVWYFWHSCCPFPRPSDPPKINPEASDLSAALGFNWTWKKMKWNEMKKRERKLTEIEGHERTWKEMKGKWKEMTGNETKWNEMKGSGRKWKEMKGNERKWKEMTGNDRKWKDMKGY